MTTAAVLLLLVNLHYFLGVDASVGIIPSGTCDKAYEHSDGSIEKICFSGNVFGPSPASFENGTTVYLGDWGTNYKFEGKYEGLEVSVSWDKKCAVAINGEACRSCSVCKAGSQSEASLSTDCTNIRQGRKVTCEPVEPLFFPLERKSSGNDGGGSSSSISGSGESDGADDTEGRGTCFKALRESCSCRKRKQNRRCSRRIIEDECGDLTGEDKRRVRSRYLERCIRNAVVNP